MEKYTLKALNEKLGNLETLYHILVDNKGLYLPKWESRSCTFTFLLIIKINKIFYLNVKIIYFFNLIRPKFSF